MNLRKIAFTILLLSMLIIASNVVAGTVVVPVNITTSLPSTSLPCCGRIYYQLIQFNVTADGTYIINDQNNALNIDLPFFWLYSSDVGPFNPANIFDNRVASGFGLSESLTTGTTYILGANTNYGTSLNGGNPVVGSYEIVIDGPGDATNIQFISVPATTSNDDPDGDGVPTSEDNCPYDYNPGQADGWGGGAGDLCDTEWYNRTGQGIAGFVQKNGVFHLHGNCVYLEDGAPRCPVVAAFDPTTFAAGQAPSEISSGTANGWSVWLYYLYDEAGKSVFQVNTYTSPRPRPDTLVDDLLEIHITGDSWQWYHRGGDPNFHGLTRSYVAPSGGSGQG